MRCLVFGGVLIGMSVAASASWARTPADIFRQTTGCRVGTAHVSSCPLVVYEDGLEMAYAFSIVNGEPILSGEDKWAPVSSCNLGVNNGWDEACCAWEGPNPYCAVFVRATKQATGRSPRRSEWVSAASAAPMSQADARAKLCLEKTDASVIERAYHHVLERRPTSAELAYWEPKKACYDEIVAANRSWLFGPAGATERRAMIERGYQEPFGRAPTDAERDYWMKTLGKSAAPVRCSGDTVDNGAELACANTEWLHSPAGAQERLAIVRRALDRWCAAKNTHVETFVWAGDDADLAPWSQSFNAHRWGLAQLDEQLALGIQQKLQACKNVHQYNTGALHKLQDQWR